MIVGGKRQTEIFLNMLENIVFEGAEVVDSGMHYIEHLQRFIKALS